MSEGKVRMLVLRETGYIQMTNVISYRAMVRVYLKMPDGGEKDLAPFIHLQALSPEELETKINNVKKQFEELLKTNPEFVKKIREPEDKEISEN